MARSNDLFTSDQGWIHELSKAEIHPEAERILNMGRSFDPQQLVEESTIEFLEELREQFTVFAKIFNGYSENGSRFQEVKIYSVAQTPADFMLYRNQIKLIVGNSAHGVIKISFSEHVRTATIDGQAQCPSGNDKLSDLMKQNEITAQVGPFRDIFWTFDQHKVNPQQVAKFYFAEYVRVTRDTKRTKLSNQLLLEQIKTLLQEKGLEI